MKPLESSHILVSRCDRIGDLVLSLPALGHLRRAQEAHLNHVAKPQLWLHCSSYARDVGEWALQNQLCSGLWVEGDPQPSSLEEGSAWGLSLFHCEAAVRAFKTAKIEHSIGPRTKISALWSYTHTLSQRRSRVQKSEMAYNVDLANALITRMGLGPLKFKGLPALKLPEGWTSPRTGADFLIVASNGGSALNWPMERYLDYAAARLAEGHSVQFLIHGTDASLRRRIWETSDLSRRTECLPAFDSLSQLIAHIASCGHVFSSSTGPLHLAHALGRPVTGLYPRIPKVQSFERWRPDGYWHSSPVNWISIF